MDQATENKIMAENFMRSAKAPAMSAGVIIAKVIWKVMKTVSGTVPASAVGATVYTQCATANELSNGIAARMAVLYLVNGGKAEDL